MQEKKRLGESDVVDCAFSERDAAGGCGRAGMILCCQESSHELGVNAWPSTAKG